jgi:hypothetical protein
MRYLPLVTCPGRNGADPGEFRERGLGVDALRVVIGDDEDLCSSIDADTKLVQQVRCSLHDELLNHGHTFLALLIEGKPAFRDRTKRMTDRVVRGF